MEKQSKLRNKILKILPKAAALTFQNPPFSPGRDHKLRSAENGNRWAKVKPHGGKGFSGPMVPMIPAEARRKPKDGGAETQEPTSPKVSCMGQIKHKKKKQQIKKPPQSTSLPRHAADSNSSASSTPRDTEAKKKQGSKFQRMFFHGAKPKTAPRKPVGDDDRAPPVGEMRRFASGREAFSNFDWRAQIAPEEIDQRDCFTDAEEEEEDEILIPFSAPILVGGGAAAAAAPNFKPRKEINLWKRRTMAPPRPIQLNPVLTAK